LDPLDIRDLLGIVTSFKSLSYQLLGGLACAAAAAVASNNIVSLLGYLIIGHSDFARFWSNAWFMSLDSMAFEGWFSFKDSAKWQCAIISLAVSSKCVETYGG